MPAQPPRPARAAGVRLQTAAATAAATLAVPFHGDVAELARAREDAAIESSAENQAAADARGHREIRHVLEAARGAEMPLRQRRGIRVVLDEDRHAERALQQFAHRHFAPARQVRRIQHHAAFGVERARNRNADRIDVAGRNPRLAQQPPQVVDDRGDVGPRRVPLRRRRAPRRGEHGAAGVAHGERHLGPADVDPQQRAHPKTSSGAQP